MQKQRENDHFASINERADLGGGGHWIALLADGNHRGHLGCCRLNAAVNLSITESEILSQFNTRGTSQHQSFLGKKRGYKCNQSFIFISLHDI